MNETTRKKLSQIHIGKKISEEHKRKISESKKGVLFFERSKSIGQYTLDDKLIKIWSSAKHAEIDGCYNATNIYQCCRGEKKTHKGYIWKYIENEKDVD